MKHEKIPYCRNKMKNKKCRLKAKRMKAK
jgi:hypothetical protein